MTNSARSRRNLVLLSVGIGLVLPSLTLIPLGSLWLWERGLILYWAVATGLLVALAAFVQRRLLREPAQRKANVDAATDDGLTADMAAWTPLEKLAWHDVVALAGRVDPGRVTSQDDALALGLETIEAVAHRIHPEVGQPLWQFTVPEAFAMLERVSRRLGVFVDEHVPLSDRLTVAQALALYRWRGALGMAEKAYDIWRVVRLANPVAAATNEARERLSKHLLQWGREHLTRQLAEAYVKEVGRAAIDLYGGRLGVGHRAMVATSEGMTPVDRAQIPVHIAEPSKPRGKWRRLWSQTANAGRTIGRTLKR